MIKMEGYLRGNFEGFNNYDTIFEFENGSKWQQDEYKYYYHYANRPKAKVIEENGRYFLEVKGLNSRVRVKRI